MWFFDDNICRALDRIWVWKTLIFIGCQARGWFLFHAVVTLSAPLLALKPTSNPASSAAAAVILDLNFPRQRSGEGSRGDFIEVVQKTHIFCFGPGIVTNAQIPYTTSVSPKKGTCTHALACQRLKIVERKPIFCQSDMTFVVSILS